MKVIGHWKEWELWKDEPGSFLGISGARIIWGHSKGQVIRKIEQIYGDD